MLELVVVKAILFVCLSARPCVIIMIHAYTVQDIEKYFRAIQQSDGSNLQVY